MVDIESINNIIKIMIYYYVLKHNLMSKTLPLGLIIYFEMLNSYLNQIIVTINII